MELVWRTSIDDGQKMLNDALLSNHPFLFIRSPKLIVSQWRQRLLEDSTIPFRFRVLIGMALGFGVLFAVSVMVGQYQLEKAMRDQATYARINMLSSDIRAQALIMESASNTYLSESNREAISQFKTAEQAAVADMEQIDSNEKASGLRDVSAQISGQLTLLHESFSTTEKLAEKMGLHDDEGFKGKLQSAAKLIDEELEVHPGVDLLISRFAQVRMAEKDFIVSHQKSALARHDRWATEFDFKIDSVTTLDPKVRESLSNNLAAYVNLMGSYATTALALDKAESQLRVGFHALQKPLIQLNEISAQGMDQANQIRDKSKWNVLIITVVMAFLTLLLFLPLAILFQRSITKPLLAVEQAMQVLASGDHSVVVPATHRQDEVGIMARALQVFKDNAQTMDRLRRDEEIASRNRMARAEMMQSLTQEFDRQVGSIINDVAQASSKLQQAATQIRGAMTVTSEAITDVNRASMDTSKGIQMMASATQELAATSDQISNRIAQSAKIAQKASGAAQNADTMITSLAESSRQIGDVVGLITTIASQTNMLALNATIEATRAGEAGRGFAVVALEVKNLAAKTADATFEVARHVATVQSATGNAVQSIHEISQTIANLSEITSSIAAAVEEQNLTTRQMAERANSTANGAQTVARRIGQVSTQAKDVDTQTALMLSEVNLSASRNDSLSTMVNKFLEAVRNG